ncbi:MAG: rod shape-determining protein MreC [Patescibacteria group bacterium]|jgi:rod shape-determining protein MreC
MWRAYALGVLVVILFLIGSDGLLWLKDGLRATESTAAGVGTATVRTKGFFGSLRDIQDLRRSVISLETRNRELESEVLRLREEARQQEVAKQQFDAARPYGGTLLVGRVVLRTPTKLHDELTLDIGAEDGVRPGLAVLVDGFLAGTTNEVGERTTTVTLLSNASSAIPVVLADSRAQGILRGGLAGIVAGDLPADVKVLHGEAVLTSALGGIVPADIPVGTVSEIASDDSDILQRAVVQSPIRFGMLERMVILVEETP